MGSKTKKKHAKETPPSASSPSTSDGDSESSLETRHRHRKDRRRNHGSSMREKERKKEQRKKEERKRERERERERERKSKKSRREERKKRKRAYDSETESDSGSGSDRETDRVKVEPEAVVRDLLNEFPNVGSDLRQLLQMIDDGQAVDIKGISERSLIKHLKTLFLSLKLKENGDRIFLLPSNGRSTLDVVGHLIQTRTESKDEQPNDSVSVKDANSNPEGATSSQMIDENNSATPCPTNDSSAPRRRVIGPEMPSAELLAAAAKLTEAQAELREAELEEDDELFIGPPPPAVVAEAESANEAERFEEVTRIMGADTDSPYDVLGANQNMSTDNIKKRYWKLSLLVHPDKCPHPQAHQAFIILNKAFKDLQDPDKRKALDEKIKLKEEQEEFKKELRAMQEAAQWRRLQGISMEGDDELLADMEFEVKPPPKRDEWMTTLPPERKPGMTMQSTRFSKSSKEGRGDTSVWTDTPLDKAQKAKMNYLEAYNEATALVFDEDEKRKNSLDADLVDKYNKEKRSKSLVQKHQEEAASGTKKKSKKEPEKAEWAGKHPWKPWDREKDLLAGRQSVKFDTENMAQGLSSRFSSGNFQRNFL